YLATTDGTGTAAAFYSPIGVVVDPNGYVYVADYGEPNDGSQSTIRKISPSGVVVTFAGSGIAASTNGIGTAASFSLLLGITLDGCGNLYVTEYGDVRKITSSAVVTTLASIGLPAGIGVD